MQGVCVTRQRILRGHEAKLKRILVSNVNRVQVPSPQSVNNKNNCEGPSDDAKAEVTRHNCGFVRKKSKLLTETKETT